MCGVFGHFRSEPGSCVVLDDIFVRLGHRGPDACGSYSSSNGKLLLGHTRLSVLDLSAGANQPMLTADKRYAISYNGEIYNFKELRQQIQNTSDVKFSTTSDSEVILAAWQVWGPAALHKFNGMFAFAIWDEVKQELWLCRDQLGIKPLFYALFEGNLVFASEIKAMWPLLHQLQFSPRINTKAVAAFLHMGFIPEPDTIYEGIHKFPAGHHACYSTKRGWKMHRWWNALEYLGGNKAATDAEAEDMFLDLLRSSVEYRMIADVPLGTFLSGGTDSSLVTAVAAELSSQPVKSFSIGFRESKFNEAGYAERVAKQLGTDHRSYLLSEKEALPLLLEMMDTFDEPFGDTSAIPTMLVSKMARRDVTVILTGDGGDELFYGYGAYDWAERLGHPVLKGLGEPIRSLLRLGGSRMKRAAGIFEKKGLVSPRDHIFSQEQYYFSNAEILELGAANENSVYTYIESDQIPTAVSHSARQAFFDLNVYLKDDLLVKVDRASMKYGLECRLPLLDYRIVAFALGISDSFKVRKGQRKWLMKKLLGKYLPADLVYRPKWGFSIPLEQWLKGELRYFLDENLSPKVLSEYGFVKQDAVLELKARFEKGDGFLYNRLWALAHLHYWLKHNA